MDVRWLGHSCFKLEESTGTSVIADPYDEKSTGIEMQPVSADVITLSHDFKNKNLFTNIVDDFQLVSSAGAFEFEGISIYGFNAEASLDKKDKDKKTIVYKYRIDGIDVCHMGDINVEPNVKLIDSIGPVNILFIPIGGKGTINAQQAKEYVDLLMPDIVIPTHYKTKESKVDYARIDEFLEMFEDEYIVELDTNRQSFDRAEFDGDDTRVMIFEREG